MRKLTPLIILLLLAPLATAPAATAAGPLWPMEGAEPSHRGAVDARTPENLSNPLAYNVGAKSLVQITEGPASLALVGTVDDRVLALTATGQVVWQVDVGAEVRSAPLWTGQVVVVVPRGEHAVAVDALGTEAWRLPIGNDRQAALVRMASPTQHPSGDVLIGDLEGHVIRVTEAGEVVWDVDLGGSLAVEATPTVTPTGDVIVAAFTPGREGAGVLVRLDGETGETVWRKQIGAQVVGAPTVTGTRVLVPLRDGDALQAHSLDDGSLDWEVTYDDHLTAAPTVHGGIALAGDIRGVMRGIRIASGEVAWTFNPLDDFLTGGAPLTVADSPAVDGDGRAWVPYWAVDMTTCCPPTGSVQSPFYLIDARTGERLDRIRLPQAPHGPGIHHTGVWSGNDDGQVRHWPLNGVLEAHAVIDGDDVTLIINTDTRGPWSIDWPGKHQEGTGLPPVTPTQTLGPGRHDVTVDTRAGTITLVVEVPGEDAPVETTPEENTSVAAGGDDGAGQGPGGGQGAGDEDRTPGAGALAAVLAAVAAAVVAGRHRRA